METKWAEENLQTIRTLMERSAVYRRALAPIMILAGVMGIAAAGAGSWLQINTFLGFIILWYGTATFVVIGAFIIARRQAFKDKEAFWSPPTRRVALALAPPLLVGIFFGVLPVEFGAPFELAIPICLVWILFYGFALGAAGFFMPRGIKYFGWLFIAGSCGIICYLSVDSNGHGFNPHWLMGFFFGGLHLAYGAYLYLTERKNPVA